MTRLFFSVAIVALSATLTVSSVEAKGNKGGSSGGSSKSGQTGNSQVLSGKLTGNQLGKIGQNGKAPFGKTFTGKDGKSYKYVQCPSNLHHCCKHYDCCHWNHFCWFGSFGCCGYYCPIESCWFYWYEPFYCYLPVRYIEIYRPVQVAPVQQIVNVNTNTNVNDINGAAPVQTGIPALPPGASDVPAGFTPPIPGKD
jgi:hypothetical protein